MLERVKLSRMSVDYAIVERARLEAQKKFPPNDALTKLAASRLEPFCEVLQQSKLSHLREGAVLDKDAYCRDLAKDLGVKAE